MDKMEALIRDFWDHEKKQRGYYLEFLPLFESNLEGWLKFELLFIIHESKGIQKENYKIADYCREKIIGGKKVDIIVEFEGSEIALLELKCWALEQKGKSHRLESCWYFQNTSRSKEDLRSLISIGDFPGKNITNRYELFLASTRYEKKLGADRIKEWVRKINNDESKDKKIKPLHTYDYKVELLTNPIKDEPFFYPALFSLKKNASGRVAE